MKRYEIFNVNCEHCVKTIKDELENEYGEISFSKDLKTIFVNECDYNEFASELDKLGFNLGKEL